MHPMALYSPPFPSMRTPNISKRILRVSWIEPSGYGRRSCDGSHEQAPFETRRCPRCATHETGRAFLASDSASARTAGFTPALRKQRAGRLDRTVSLDCSKRRLAFLSEGELEKGNELARELQRFERGSTIIRTTLELYFGGGSNAPGGG